MCKDKIIIADRFVSLAANIFIFLLNLKDFRHVRETKEKPKTTYKFIYLSQ